MRLKTAAIILLALATNIGVCAQTRGTSSKSTGKARTTATTKKSTTKAKSATPQSPIATLTALLEKKKALKIENIAELNKELAWAKTIEEKVGNKLKFKAEGSVRALLYEVERYYDVIKKLENHIGNSRKYNQSGITMINGAMVKDTFMDFLLLQHINDILGLLPDDESKSAFKENMVAMFKLKSAYLSYLQDVMSGLGLVGMGAMAELEYISTDIMIAKASNDFLFQLWENIKGDGSTCFDKPQEYIDKINLYFNYALKTSDYVSLDIINKCIESVTEFNRSAGQFVDSYNQWLKAYPAHNSKVKTTAAMLFKNYFTNSKSYLDDWGVDTKEILEKAEKENRVYATTDQKATFPDGDIAMYQWLGNNIVKPAESNGTYSVVAEFIVEKDGSISDPQIIRGSNEQLNAEVIRVLQLMPKWTPGRNNGEAVRSRSQIILRIK